MSQLAIILSQLILLAIAISFLKFFELKSLWIFLIIPIIIVIFFVIECLPLVMEDFSVVKGFKGDSFNRRLVLFKTAWQVFKFSPVFGVGLGNFIPAMVLEPIGRTYFIQPVHNIPALILAETGLAGLALITLAVFLGLKNLKFQSSKLKTKAQSLKLILIFWWVIIAVTAMFDHYWLTLQQGRLMLVLAAGLTLIRKD